MSALDDAIAAHMAHPAASGFDCLTDSLVDQQAPQPGPAAPPLKLREGWEHEPIELPITPRWALMGLAVLLLTLLLSACGGGDCDDDDTKNTGPVDCRAHPEQCR